MWALSVMGWGHDNDNDNYNEGKDEGKGKSEGKRVDGGKEVGLFSDKESSTSHADQSLDIQIALTAAIIRLKDSFTGQVILQHIHTLIHLNTHIYIIICTYIRISMYYDTILYFIYTYMHTYTNMTDRYYINS